MLRLQAVFDVRPGLGGAWHPFWIAADELSACTGQAHWSIFPKQTANSWPVKQVQFGVSGVDRGREDRRCQRSSGVEQRTHNSFLTDFSRFYSIALIALKTLILLAKIHFRARFADGI